MLKSFTSAPRRLVCQIHGFSSTMIFIIFLIYVPFIHSVSHTLITTYTGVNGQTVAETPEVSYVTKLDGQQIDYYDGVIKKLIPTQDWMKEFAATETWKEYTEIREQVQQTNKLNIPDLMQRFSQTGGDDTYQRVYGCDWDDETGDSSGFDEYSYDGDSFISLDLKENRYKASVPQAEPTVEKWNEDRERLVQLKLYYRYECVDWLKELLHYSKASSEKTGKVPESTEQSLSNPAVSDNTSDGSDSYSSNIIIAVVIIIPVILGPLIYCCWNHIRCDYNEVKYYKENKSTPQGASNTEDSSQSGQSLIESSESLASSQEQNN